MTSVPETPRATALDAFRGLTILLMVLVFVQPYETMPAWMYHAQEPPPTHQPQPSLYGLTWPDLVFPFFLFALGAAIPLALGRRLDAGESKVGIVRSIGVRAAMLLFFAVFRQHFDVSVNGMPQNPPALLFALAGFVALFLIFTRFPATWSSALQRSARVAGWVLALAMLVLVRFPDGSGFSLSRFDGVLQVLAHIVVWGSLAWWATRHSITARLLIVAVIIGFRFLAWRGGWASAIWNVTPPTFLLFVGHLVYLCVAIPGTIAGDLIAARAKKTTSPDALWSSGRLGAIMAALLLTVPVTLVGVQARQIWPTAIVIALVSAVLVQLTRGASHPAERLVRGLVLWGAFWTILGICLDPAYGGISKWEANPAWMFGTAGLATLVLAALVLVTELFNRPRLVSLFTDNGQNPMIAYVANGMLILPLLALATIKDRFEAITPGPWAGFLRGVIITLLIAYVVRFFTRWRLLWRT